MFVVRRYKNNPILRPDPKSSFENFAAFNGNPIKVGKEIHLLYRAQSMPERFEGNSFSLSVVGKAESRDGFNFKNRNEFIVPEHSWERFGCEDPRVTKIDGKYFCFYTALSAYPLNIPAGIKVGLAISSDMKTVSEKHLVTPFNAKAMTLFPEKIDGKYVALLTVNSDVLPTHITLAKFNKVEDIWDEKYWLKWKENFNEHMVIRGDDNDRIEIGSCPLKTERGWLIICCRIQNHSAPDRVFAVEAYLLDLKDPQKIIGKTRSPLLVPEEVYEKEGLQVNIIFPSGALIDGDKLLIYYGATDTTVGVATVLLPPLLDSMSLPYKETGFKRLTDGALIVPRKEKSWEAKAVFNPGAIDLDGAVRILYRAMGNDNTSVMGYAESKDGTALTYISNEPVYVPREPFEEKRIPNGNSGCEDPRLIKMGDVIYMYYTAYNGVDPWAIAQTHISEKDFKSRNWKWSKPVLVSTPGMEDKDGCLHPEKVGGKYFLFHRINNFICGDFGSTPEFKERSTFKNTPIITPRHGMWDSIKVGTATPPIKTGKGWILLYHGIGVGGRYSVGAALLDLKDPTKVLSRTTDAIFEPKEDYELTGQVGNVVFPCGAIVRGDTIFIYYGGADSVIDVASVSLKELLDALTK